MSLLYLFPSFVALKHVSSTQEKSLQTFNNKTSRKNLLLFNVYINMVRNNLLL